MERKVVKHGPGTLTISLPKSFVESQRIRQGQYLQLLEAGSNLLVSKGPSAPQKATLSFQRTMFRLNDCEVDANNDLQRTVRLLVGAAYRRGVDELEVTFDQPEVLDILQQQSREVLIGFEIVDQGVDRCLIKHLAKEEVSNLSNLIDRLYQIVSTMGSEITLRLATCKAASGYAQDMEVMSNKFHNLCERMLNKFSYDSHTKHYTYSKGLEMIADNYRDVCKALGEKPPRFRQQFIKLMNNFLVLLAGFHVCYRKFELDRAAELTRQLQDMAASLPCLFAIAKPHEALVCAYVLSMIRIAEVFGDVFIQEVK